MKINITARHFKAKGSLQNYVKAKLEELGKYNENILFADVVFSFEKPPADTKHCEILIKLKNKKITANEPGIDFEKAVDKAVEKIDTQLYKYKDKIKTHKHENSKQSF